MEFISIGSGDGWFTPQIAKIARRVVAIDIDPNLLEVWRHRLTEYGATNCDYVAGDADELAKLVPRLADFVFMATAFHGVPDRSRLAPCSARSTEAGRTLRDRQLASACARGNSC